MALGGERQAHVPGFDLHANVAVPAGDRSRLEHLARHVLRPPVVQDALELTEARVGINVTTLWRKRKHYGIE